MLFTWASYGDWGVVPEPVHGDLVASAPSVELKGSGHPGPFSGRPHCLQLGLDSGLRQEGKEAEWRGRLGNRESSPSILFLSNGRKAPVVGRIPFF